MDFATVLITLFLFVLGAVVGSFLNVVIHRLPRGESVLGVSHDGSHCPRCGIALKARDLVPLLSWLSLGGRCRGCATRISSRYFWVELLTGLLFIAAGLSSDLFEAPWDLLHKLILIVLFIPIFFIDLDHRIVLEVTSLPVLVVGFLWNLHQGLSGHPWLVTLATPGGRSTMDISLPSSLVFACTCAGVFSIIRWIGSAVYHREAMGLGDLDIAAGIGANLAILDALCSFGIAIAVGAILGIIIMAVRGRDKMDAMPFGPPLVIGALILILMPGPIHHFVEWYRLRLHP